MSDPSTSPRHLVQLHLLVLLLAFTAILGKLCSLSFISLVTWRTSIAALATFLWLALRHPGAARLPWKDRGILLGIGAIVGLHWLCFFGSIEIANVSICLVGLATISLFTSLIEPFFERRRIRPFEVGLGLVAIAGMSLVAGFERNHLAGLGLALLGAFLASLFTVLNRHLAVRGGEPMRMVSWEMVGAFLACLPLVPWLQDSGYPGLLEWRRLDWLWILLLALLCTVFSHGYAIHLFRYLSAYTGSLAINFEPIYGMLLAAALFNEHLALHPAFYLGTLGIVGANLLHPWLLKRYR